MKEQLQLDLVPVVSIRSLAVPPTATAQQKGAFVVGGRVRFYTKKEVREAESDWWHIVAPSRPASPLDGPLWLRACLAWDYTASTPKRVRDRKAVVPNDRRPDLDNLIKSMLDVLTKTSVIAEDARIALLVVSKVRAPHAGVSIDIGPLPRVLSAWTPEEQMQLDLFPLET